MVFFEKHASELFAQRYWRQWRQQQEYARKCDNRKWMSHSADVAEIQNKKNGTRRRGKTILDPGNWKMHKTCCRLFLCCTHQCLCSGSFHGNFLFFFSTIFFAPPFPRVNSEHFVRTLKRTLKYTEKGILTQRRKQRPKRINNILGMRNNNEWPEKPQRKSMQVDIDLSKFN